MNCARFLNFFYLREKRKMKKIDIWNDLTKLYEDSSSYVSGLSQLDHALQAADAARRSGADSETIVAALLHDGKSVSSRTHTHILNRHTQNKTQSDGNFHVRHRSR